jgi:TPR repeat protein
MHLLVFSSDIDLQKGDKIKKDKIGAAKFFQRAADQGRVEGIVYLGKGYCTDIGLPWDFAKALELFKQAADRDDIEDVCEYAYMLIYALGVNRDWVQATALYKRAADGGHGLAQ